MAKAKFDIKTVQTEAQKSRSAPSTRASA